MTITSCPNCHSTNLDLGQNVCLDCYRTLDADTKLETTTPSVEELQNASDAIDEAKTPEDKTLALIAFEKTVLNRYARGFRVVTLIGFSGAGKTFFAHRLRRELSLSGWSAEPAHDETIPQTGATIEATQLVKGGKEPHLRLLVDCDGEAFRNGVERMLKGGDITDAATLRFIVITALASGFILMLPAAGVLGRKNDPKTNTLIERFGVIVKAILALQRSVRETNAREAINRGLEREYFLNALEYEFRCDLPIHVLFAQADRLAGEQNIRDPHMFALRGASTLYRTIESHFKTFRFDFACAFDGHPANVYDVDYNLPSYGTVAAFNWIDEMIDGGKIKRAQTAAAMTARRIVDGRFRKAAAKVAG